MSTIAQRVAFRVVAEAYFSLAEARIFLDGETVYKKKLPEYERQLREATEEYRKLLEERDRLRTPGVSQPKMQGTGRALRATRRKGLKARARVEIAKALKAAKYLNSVRALPKALESAKHLTFIADHEDVLKGETVFAKDLAKYKKAYEKVKKQYDEYNDKHQRQRGTGYGRSQVGQGKSGVGKELKRAKARYDVALWLQEHSEDPSVKF